MDGSGTAADALIGAGHGLWSELRDEVRRHLERHGLPALPAEQCSHEIVVRCAAEHPEDGPARLRERALAEAETRLIGWRAGRAGDLRDAA